MFVGSISFIQSLCVNFKLIATAVLVVGRLVYVTMSDTVGPEFYSKTVNRTIRGSAVAKSVRKNSILQFRDLKSAFETQTKDYQVNHKGS